jgi:hypothetical protein
VADDGIPAVPAFSPTPLLEVPLQAHTLMAERQMQMNFVVDWQLHSMEYPWGSRTLNPWDGLRDVQGVPLGYFVTCLAVRCDGNYRLVSLIHGTARSASAFVAAQAT